MKKLIAILIVGSLAFTACDKKEGCTDASATNFDSEAEEDNGSCILPTVVADSTGNSGGGTSGGNDAGGTTTGDIEGMWNEVKTIEKEYDGYTGAFLGEEIVTNTGNTAEFKSNGLMIYTESEPEEGESAQDTSSYTLSSSKTELIFTFSDEDGEFDAVYDVLSLTATELKIQVEDEGYDITYTQQIDTINGQIVFTELEDTTGYNKWTTEIHFTRP